MKNTYGYEFFQRVKTLYTDEVIWETEKEKGVGNTDCSSLAIFKVLEKKSVLRHMMHIKHRSHDDLVRLFIPSGYSLTTM